METLNPTTERRSANYQPSIWHHSFMESLNTYANVLYEQRVKKLEEEVKSMIDDDDAEPLPQLELIDDIQRLGLGYRFEENIRRAIDRIFSSKMYHSIMEKSLHATALIFRLLRQNGYEVSQDVFKRFKDQKGNFITGLGEDVKGMLDLFEASYLALEGEDLLDEAKEFTSLYLKNMEASNIQVLVSHATKLPLHRRMLRLEARWYIEAYEKREDANSLLLELAKHDFNMVQSIHQRDLEDTSKWWRSTGLANNLSFARDRIMECFIWTVGITSEPHFSKCRKELAKVGSFITVVDDIYDVYGSLDELEIFTDAVERWDVDAISNLPDYMKLCFQVLYDTVNEMANDIPNEQGVTTISYLRKAWADLCKSFLKEAKWCNAKHKPSLKEYLDNAWLSSSGGLILVHVYFLVSQNMITKEATKCLENYHDLLRWPSMILRLYNDLATSTVELERGETTNAISCYMHEFGHSEEVARDHIRKMIDETWKKMNKDGFADSPFPKPLVEASINLARTAQCFYQHGDGHSAPNAKSKKIVMSLMVEPVGRVA